MNRNAKMATLAVILSWVIGSVSAAQTRENLITNPGFEEGDKGWKFYDHTDGLSKYVVTPGGRDGKNAAKLSLVAGPTGDNGCLEQYLARKELAGKRYRFSLWAKCLDSQIGYNLGYVTELPGQTFHWIKPVEWRGDWAQYSVVFDSAADTTAFAAGTYIRHPGELWVDDFSLVEAPGAELSTQTQPEPQPAAPAPPPEAKPQSATPKSGAAAPAQSAEVTRFFKEHPNNINFEEKGDSLLFANRQIGLEFQRVGQQGRQGFRVTRMYGIRDGQDFLLSDSNPNLPNLFQIVLDVDPSLRKRVQKGCPPVGSSCARTISFSRTGNDAESTLRLEWKDIDLADEKAKMDMEVFVTLKADDPFAYWRFSLKNRSITYGVDSVYFPVLDLSPIGDASDNVYIFPRDRGRLVEAPFSQPAGYGEGIHQSGIYPASFNMQFEALYNKRSGVGLYLGTQDPIPCRKNTEAPNYPTHITWKVAHFPPDIGFADQDFTLPYECVVGPFTGDWWDACQIYRNWALKQSWCRKGPTTTREDVPKWYKEAPIFLMAASWEKDENVAKSVAHALEYRKFAGMPLPMYWYSWKEYKTELTAYDVPYSYYRVGYREQTGPCSNVHDGCYPKVPALPSFAAACKELRKAGIRVLPYVCLQVYDQGPAENAPYAAEARPWAERNVFGDILNYSNEPPWAMCVWSSWWRNRLKETCVTLMRQENAGGVYLDTMHGHADPCWWTPHGHSAYGGSSPTVGMHQMAELLRNAVKETDPEAITSGENPAENMIDVIDGKMYYATLFPTGSAPLFAAVYGDYVRRHGMELFAGDENRFCMEAATLFVEGAQLGRAHLEPVGGSLSFGDVNHKGMVEFLGRLLGRYRQADARKFLCYGQLMRPLTFQRPAPMPEVSHGAATSAPAWMERGGMRLPALLSGVFHSADGELGVFIVNISKEEISFASELDLARYGMKSAKANVETISSEGDVKAYSSATDGKLALQGTLPARQVAMFRLMSASK